MTGTDPAVDAARRAADREERDGPLYEHVVRRALGEADRD